MSNLRQPDGGTAITGPLTMIGPDGSYIKVVDTFGAVVAPQQPLVTYTKPPGVSAATPSNTMVQQLCTLLAPLAAEALMKNSVMLSRICLMPQQVPASGLGYSSLAATYTYTFGATTVTVSPTTRNTYSETLPVDLTISNPTLVADLANRMGAQLAAAADQLFLNAANNQGTFTTNAAQGTAATQLTDAVIAAAVALIPNTGEPIFLAVYPYEVGLAYAVEMTLNGSPLVPFLWTDADATITTLANSASPTASLQGVWVLPCGQVPIAGGAPGTGTIRNLMFTPSAFAAVFEIETYINNTNTTPIANCSATGSFGNCTVTVWAKNSGSGAQAIYCSMVLGVAGAIIANGVQVKS